LLTDIQTILAPLVSALVTAALIAVLLRMKRALPMDHPNHRSLHEQPMPRTGGIGIMLGVACGWAALWPAALMPVLGLALALAGLSLLDDARGLSAGLRLGLQIAAAASFIALRPSLPGGFWGAAAALLAVVWMTNLFNFMDGANGLAGGMALFGFGFYALAAGLGGAPALAAAALCVAAAAAGFLWFNFDPARIFMGDAGSIPLGFLAAALGLAGWQDGVWPLGFPVLVFSPFIVDASVTLLKRLSRGEKVWQAHREHYYQRLVRMGLGHRRTALAGYCLMLVCGLSALALSAAPPPAQIAILLAWCALYGLALSAVDRAWGRHAAEPRP
jgi:UDP-N-acetylmuramyl pentapeptide phosphotransferase/UDP-N-acetylglucosamine-1-phosphate transferase